MRISDWSSDVCSSDLYVTKIHINDLSGSVYSFWKAVLNETEELCRLVKNTPLTVGSWDRQKRIFANRSEEHTSELQSPMRISYAVFCLKKKNKQNQKLQQTMKEKTKTDKQQ